MTFSKTIRVVVSFFCVLIPSLAFSMDAGYVLDPIEKKKMRSSYDQFLSCLNGAQAESKAEEAVINSMHLNYPDPSNAPATAVLFINFLDRSVAVVAEELKALEQAFKDHNCPETAKPVNETRAWLFEGARMIESALHGKHSGINTARKATPQEKEIMLHAAMTVGDVIAYRALKEGQTVEETVKTIALNHSPQSRSGSGEKEEHVNIVNAVIRTAALIPWIMDYKYKGDNFSLDKKVIPIQDLAQFIQGTLPYMDAGLPEDVLELFELTDPLTIYATWLANLSSPGSLEVHGNTDDALIEAIIGTDCLKKGSLKEIHIEGGDDGITDQSIEALMPFFNEDEMHLTLRNVVMSYDTLGMLLNTRNLRELTLSGKITAPMTSEISLPGEWNFSTLDLEDVTGFTDTMIDEISKCLENTAKTPIWGTVKFPDCFKNRFEQLIHNRNKIQTA